MSEFLVIDNRRFSTSKRCEKKLTVNGREYLTTGGGKTLIIQGDGWLDKESVYGLIEICLKTFETLELISIRYEDESFDFVVEDVTGDKLAAAA